MSARCFDPPDGCGQPMSPGGACTLTRYPEQPVGRIPYGGEAETLALATDLALQGHPDPAVEALTRPCHDCNVRPGAYHHPGCDWERCAVCGGQAIACSCDDNDEDEDDDEDEDEDDEESDPNVYATVECGHEVMHVGVTTGPLQDGAGQPLPSERGVLVTTTRRCCACHAARGGQPSAHHPLCVREQQLRANVIAAAGRLLGRKGSR